MSDFYLQLSSEFVLDDLGTAGLLQKEGELLDALPIDTEEGVSMDFDTVQQIACIHGLSEEARQKLIELTEYDCGEAFGKVTIIPNPHRTDTASE